MRKAIIYGTGSYYEQNKHKLPKDLEIAAYADSNPNNATSHHGELFRGLPMLLPEEFETVVYDVVYICTDYTAGNQIFQKLSAIGIDSDRIFFLNRMEPSADWKYEATEDGKGYLSTIDGIMVKERYRTDFDIVHEVLIEHSYGFGFENEDYIVIDIGMNVAIASLYFAKQSHVKKVYGFEAFPDTYEQAAANIALNQPGIGDKIEAVNFALSDENGRKLVAVSAEETGWRNIFSKDKNRRQMEIVCRDAGEVVSGILNQHKEKIVLKVDTEGAEFPIFAALDRAGWFGKIDVIMMEYHGDSEKLLSILKKYGYRYFIQGKNMVCGLIHAIK